MVRHLTTISIFLILFSHNSVGQTNISGTFVGLLRISEWTDENGKYRYYGDDFDPKAQWYHETILTIKNDSVWVAKNPVRFYKGKKYYSASDGAFYYYRGTINKYKSKKVILLVLKNCDYCPISRKFEPPNLFKSSDTLILNSDTTNLEKQDLEEEYDYAPQIKYLSFFAELTKDNNLLINDKTIFKRKKSKK